jgi:hypothetical protein
MSNGLAPHSFASAARELIRCGMEVLEGSLAQNHPVSWRAHHPPRGRRRAGAPPPAGDAKTFVLVSPLSLPEPFIQRLKALCGRLTRATASPVSLATVVREAISVGHEARERGRREAQELLAQQVAVLRAAGLPVPLEPIAVSSVLIAPYSHRGPTDPWANPQPRAKRAPSPPKAATTAPRTAQRPRARSPRRKAATRRADRTEGSDDDGADPPGRTDALERPAYTTVAPPQPLTDTDRRLLDHLIEMTLRA